MVTTFPTAAYPAGLRIRMAVGLGGTMVDMSQYINRPEVTLDGDGLGKTTQANFPMTIPGGGGYDIHDNIKTVIDAPTDPRGPVRYFGGYTMGAVSNTVGSEKVWTIRCVSNGILGDKPPKAVTYAYPPGGTPVIATSCSTSIAAGTRTFTPAVMRDLFVNKRVFAANPDGTNKERITLSAMPSTTTVTAAFLTAKTAISTSIAATLPAGQQTVTPASMAGIAVGVVLTITDSGGGNSEIVNVTAVTGTTFTALFTAAHGTGALVKAGWLIFGGITDREFIADGFNSCNGYSTTVGPAISAGAGVVVTPASMANIAVGQLLYCSQPGSVNNEMVTVTATTSTTFTATFGSSKAANWIIKPLIAYRSILDFYYNDVGFTVSKAAIFEINPSLPNVSLEPGSVNKALDKIRTLSYAVPRINTASSTAIAAGNRTVTVQDISNIQVGSQVWCSDMDGATNKEYVTVTAVNPGLLQFTAAFQLPKNNGWLVWSPAAPLYYWGFFQDDNFTPQLFWFDLFDPTRRTAYELTDVLVLNPAMQVRYSEYSRNIDGARRINAQTVIGANGAIGYYVDTAAVAAVGRVIEGEPILDTTLTTNQQCIDKATAYVNNYKFAKEVVTIGTKSQVSPAVFYEAHTVKWGNQAEGGTPAVYNIAHRHLEFSTGNPKYLLEIGDRYEELGDAPQPAYGASTTHDFEAPSTPRWVGGSFEWVISNTYNRITGLSDITVQCALGAEFDLLRVGFRYRVAGSGFSPLLFVTVNGGADSAQFSCSVPPSTVIDFEASAYDRTGNFSPPSTLATVTSAALLGPLPPTAVSVAFIPTRGEYELLRVSCTGSTSPFAYKYRYYLTIAGNSFTADGFPGSPPPTVFDQAIRFQSTGSVYITCLDAQGHEGNASATVTWTQFDTAFPPQVGVYNGDFAIPDPADVTKAFGWTGTGAGGAGGTLDNSDAYAGPNSLKLAATVPVSPEVTSAKVLVNAKRTYLLRMFAKTDNAAPTAFYAKVTWYDKSSAVISTSTGLVPGALTTAWVEQPKQLVPPAGSASAVVIVGVGSGTTYNVWVDGISLDALTEVDNVKDSNISQAKLGSDIRGTTFPSSPATGQEFYRTDLNRLCYWDGTQWLGPLLLLPYVYRGVGAIPFLPVNAPDYLLTSSVDSTYDWKVVRSQLALFVATTNDTANYWSVQLRKDGTLVGTVFDTHLDAANTWLKKSENNIAALVEKTRGALEVYVAVPLGTPGKIYIQALTYVREVIP